MHTLNNKKINNENKIIYWNCKRGMLELDKILITFFKNYYKNLNYIFKKQFKKLLIQNDNIIYIWLFETKIKKYPTEFKEIILIIKHTTFKGKK